MFEIIEGIFGKRIRITNERWNHIIENHPEMETEYDKMVDTLQYPDEVVESKSDSFVTLYYRKYYHTIVGDKYMSVVVKTVNTDNFMLTAYFTDTIKKGNLIWKRK